jgi:hypothetical protein
VVKIQLATRGQALKKQSSSRYIESRIVESRPHLLGFFDSSPSSPFPPQPIALRPGFDSSSPSSPFPRKTIAPRPGFEVRFVQNVFATVHAAATAAFFITLLPQQSTSFSHLKYSLCLLHRGMYDL